MRISNIHTISKRYAKALLLLAQEDKKLEVYQKNLEMLSLIFSKNSEVIKFLENSKVSLEKKIGFIDNVFKEKLHKNIINFLKLLIKKNKIIILPFIVDTFGKLCDEILNIARVSLVMAVQPTPLQVKELQNGLENILKKKIAITTHIDENILGGIKIIVGSILIDASLQGKLQFLYKNINTRNI